ncbi:MAG: VWA domain-containing protein [Chloroflexi bacterium]|nr:VWA domain-containing protein [Chloroflexota bacterium]
MSRARATAIALLAAAGATLGMLGWGVIAGPVALGQGACVADVEPNDTPEEATTLAAPMCIEGTLPDGDQDLFLWTVSEADAGHPWTFTIEGPPATLTSAKLLPIVSEPGAVPIRPGNVLLAVDHGPDAFEPTATPDILLRPGRYLLGISRSSTADGSLLIDPPYRLEIVPGTPLPPIVEQEPNQDAATATVVADLFAVSGDLQETRDVYRWTVSDAIADQPVTIRLHGPVASGMALTLRDEATGASHRQVTLDERGIAHIDDLRLPAGGYQLELTPSMDVRTPYVLSASPSEVADADPEPNDHALTAVPLDPARPVARGRLTVGDSRDRYLLTVDDALAAGLLDIRLLWREGPDRELCLETLQQRAIQCRRASDGVSIDGLTLPVGQYVIAVSGQPAPFSMYLLRVDMTTAPAPDFETEPNDDIPNATRMRATDPMRGRFGIGDRDVFRVTVTGEAQLWQLDATGPGVRQARWLKADGSALAEVRGAPDPAAGPGHATARLTDLYLIPGDHWFRLDGATDGEYSLTFTPLGPPDPAGEREPNDVTLNAEPLGVGVRRTGRLPRTEDTDVFRFSLDERERVRVAVEPPDEAAIRLRVAHGTNRLTTLTSPGPGAQVTWDALLQPGDYEIWLDSTTPSTERYALTVTRLDPFAITTDQEPNDRIALAVPLPASLHIEGDGTRELDNDWYALGVLPHGGDLVVRITGDLRGVRVSDGSREYRSEDDREGGHTIAGLPAGVPLWLRLDAVGPYTAQVEPGTTGLAGPVPPPPPLAASVVVTATPLQVAAYRDVGQAVAGVVTITNDASADQRLHLDAATSAHRWTVTFDAEAVDVPAAGSTSVPFVLEVPADVPPDRPVRVTVRARDAAGAQVTGSLDIDADRDIEPVGPRQSWMLPPELLGGLDLAASALGGVPVGATDGEAEAQLYDGLTPAGGGFRSREVDLPITFTVDLAGDMSVPVVGTILDAHGNRDSTDPVPRAFTLLLSEDGTTWQEVLQAELTPRNGDQPFVLPAPVPARFAQLRIESTWGSPDRTRVVLGAWKVVAQPGVVPDGLPIDISEPARGGHMVRMQPNTGIDRQANEILTEDPTATRRAPTARAGTRLTGVVGFLEGRLALLDRLEWVDPTGSDPGTRVRRIDVEVSEDSPVGPWTSVGTWPLERAGDGTIEPFVLPDATWARYVRFTSGPSAEGTRAIELPALLRVIERRDGPAPGSILGEWGQGDPRGPRDLLEPPDLTTVTDDDVDDDTPDQARPLTAGLVAQGRVHRGRDVDWYAVTIPEGERSVRFTVGGTPSVGVALTMLDPDGRPVPMTFAPGDAPGTMRYEANVTPGATYRVRVAQPPFSAVFTFDTSGSMGRYLAFVSQALRAYTAGVIQGSEQVLVIPFEEEPLLGEWSDQPYQLQDAVDRHVANVGSSSAEAALVAASERLAGREGARAILLVTDAETSSYGRSEEMWTLLSAVRPMVFAVHIGADSNHRRARNLMQDWAMAGGGAYAYARSHADIDQAFDRMATRLRRPASYTLVHATSPDELPPPTPGRLSVVAPADGDGTQSAVVGRDVAVELILDTSGSMLERFGGQRRIDVARSVLAALVRDDIPPGVNVALRTFVRAARSCDTELAIPLGPLDPEAMASHIESLRVLRSVRTPLAAAISAVADDLADVTGPRIVIVVSDGEESCGGNPQRAVRQLVAQGFDVTVNVVGLALDDRRVRRSIQRLAELGRGTYFDARDPDQVARAIRAAVSAPFQVFDEAGEVVATGTVGGGAVEVPPGTYRVVVRGEPPVVYEGIVVETEGSVVVTLPSAGDRPADEEDPDALVGSEDPEAESEPSDDATTTD